MNTYFYNAFGDDEIGELTDKFDKTLHFMDEGKYIYIFKFNFLFIL